MKLETAVQLIERGVNHTGAQQHWADLGAGSGLFSHALGELLPSESTVTAVDQNAAALKSMLWSVADVQLKRVTADFTGLDWGNDYDGLLMANSLHYVLDAKTFLSRAKSKLKANGRMIIVEYERRSANAWVPYPLRFEQLKEVASAAGFSTIEKLHEVPSVFDDVKIYSALLTS